MKIGIIDKANFQSVAEIYKQGINSGIATFETEVPSWDNWNQSHLEYGRITATNKVTILGWAALSPVSGRCVYGGVAEVSVYVSKDHQNRGVGYFLLQNLIKISELNGIWTLQSGIFPNNDASITLHKKCGFRLIGYRERIAQLNGKWHDNVLMERRSNIVGN